MNNQSETKEVKEFSTRIEMLNDTIQYFWGKPERKSTTSRKPDSISCAYSSSNPLSEGCAIGRYLPKDLSKKLDLLTMSSVGNDHIFNMLPEWMKKFDKDFLCALQGLHDGDYLFNRQHWIVHAYMKEYVDISQIIFPD